MRDSEWPRYDPLGRNAMTSKGVSVPPAAGVVDDGERKEEDGEKEATVARVEGCADHAKMINEHRHNRRFAD